MISSRNPHNISGIQEIKRLCSMGSIAAVFLDTMERRRSKSLAAEVVGKSTNAELTSRFVCPFNNMVQSRVARTSTIVLSCPQTRVVPLFAKCFFDDQHKL